MRSIVRWALSNSAALNLLVVAVLFVGMYSASQMHRETFPEFDLDIVLVTVPYPGAAPQEVEEGLCQKIEEAVRTIDGVKKVTSIASEGSCNVVIELHSYVDNADRVLDDVRSEVDRIPSMPLEAEDPVIRRITLRYPAIRVGVVAPSDTGGTNSELRLREVCEIVREDLLSLPMVSQVEYVGARDYQIDVEISEETLRAHGLTLKRVADILRRENRELPAGSIRSESQEVLLRGNNRRTRGEDIAKLPLVTQADGAVLTVADLGTVRDEFADEAAISRINGKPGLALSVERSKSEDLLGMVDAVKEYVHDKKLPYGYELVTWGDESVEVRSRLDLLVRNGWQGLLVVFLLLVMFLDLRLAFWVALGIPFAVFASTSYLFATDQSLNMISMFAFVMALGIVVDDAIVVGENIYAHHAVGKSWSQAALDGTVEVMPSVSVSVATTIVAFSPLLFVTGVMGKFMAVMPAAIIAMLLVSLFESVTILPCHLSHEDSLLFRFFGVVFYIFRGVVPLAHWLNRVCTSALMWYIHTIYEPTLRIALRYRSVVVSGCIAVLIITAGMVNSGIAPRIFFPELDGNTLVASVTFPDGTPESVTDKWARHIESAFWQVARHFEQQQGSPIATLSYRIVGSQMTDGNGPGGIQNTGSGSHLASVQVELVPTEERVVSSEQFIKAWRDEVKEIPGTERLTFKTMAMGPGGVAIEFKILGRTDRLDQLDEAVERAKQRLAEYDGVFDIGDDSIPGKWEYRFRIKPEAMALGVKTADLAETVRAAYYGEEVMRLQRGRHEVKLMVRYPREERRQMANFDEIRVRLDDGIERPITELAEIDVVRGYSEINRINQMRSITVTADVDANRANAQNIIEDLKKDFFPQLTSDFEGISIRWEGEQEQRRESIESLRNGFVVALLIMFGLLALEFKSYFQPFLVMLIIPFGIIGAVWGHVIMGIPVSMFSLFGLVALTGIVVNDSIVLIDFINSGIRAGVPVEKALTAAGTRRFRPVMLTTVTTVGGLTPLLLETSLQAQVIIPMAVSIAFGEIFATILVLYIVPVTYSIYWSLVGRHIYLKMQGHELTGSDDDTAEPVNGARQGVPSSPTTSEWDEIIASG
ncbi:MAG: efflux RND transporter permease subunit [Pirellulaceae bacterium]|nr:efflux RND transporter permease subunit [Planctomycetales bacterium]